MINDGMQMMRIRREFLFIKQIFGKIFRNLIKNNIEVNNYSSSAKHILNENRLYIIF